MGLLKRMFGLVSNKWVQIGEYSEQTDCGGDGHKIRVVSGELRIYPNQQLLRTLQNESPIIMQFSANGSIFNQTYEMQVKDNYVIEKYFQFTMLDFEKILHRYGAIQIGLNGIMTGFYNSKGYFR